ncbi:GRP family sugar transporter [Metabacillus rhizolycopersici]|uniref:GRP family sugar transporter n=1 Tax=Metabacillus rhizolycopersici TaxID=2875709 RepID=A0ABS7V0M6_9BACI|nr:GRP family sugar transporter [Metabacillus rhizolycopersici]MBZ5753852.1 GRP family sugar transporter [Metabacillus rhizolycopersici]
MTGILLAILAAVSWGSIVFVSNKLGGDENSQTLGTTVGALVFAIVVYIYKMPELSTVTWAVGFVSGLLWCIGQKNQFGAVRYLGVAKTAPISTGLQLIGTTFFGVFIFKEWQTTTSIVIGLAGLACIIIGALLTSLNQGDDKGQKKSQKEGLLILLFSTVGFVTYVVLIRRFNIDGWAAILPQAIGMVTGAFFITIRDKPYNKYAIRNILTGLIWSTGNLGLLLALPKIGVATSFSISQTGIVISTIGGLFFLNERKSKKQVWIVLLGCLFIIIGGVLLGLTKR